MGGGYPCVLLSSQALWLAVIRGMVKRAGTVAKTYNRIMHLECQARLSVAAALLGPDTMHRCCPAAAALGCGGVQCRKPSPQAPRERTQHILEVA